MAPVSEVRAHWQWQAGNGKLARTSRCGRPCLGLADSPFTPICFPTILIHLWLAEGGDKDFYTRCFLTSLTPVTRSTSTVPITDSFLFEAYNTATRNEHMKPPDLNFNIKGQIVKENFDFKYGMIAINLDLKRGGNGRFLKTTAYGHFGRDDADFTWEVVKPLKWEA
ncbi:hypothetical protein V2J09_013862 [Rumex salicifolius]